MASTTGGYTVKRGRLKGIEVKPGSVRQARMEAGLSLAGVAGQDLTRAAIHLIETGKSRPSMPTLELISRRTGKPLSYFLAPEDGLSRSGGSAAERRMLEIEQLLETGQMAETVAAATELLPSVSDPWDLARLHLWIGRAQVQLRSAEAAVGHLRIARDLFERQGDEWLAVEALDWEGSALYIEHDPGALALTEQALARARALEPRDTALEVRILSHLGNILNLRYDWEGAVKYLQAAIELSDQVRDLGRIARMYQALGISYEGMGRPDQGLGYTQKAMVIFRMLNDQVSMASVENSLGLLMMRMGDLAGAENQLRASIRHMGELGIKRAVSHPILSLAELQIARGSLDDADRSVREAMTLAAENDERLSIGLGHQFLGQIAGARREEAEADRNFEQALAIFTQEDATERLVDCRSAYARVLEERGDTRGALKQTKLALEVRRPSLARPAAGPAERRGAETAS